MNNKMTTNSQLWTNLKQKQKQTKQTTRTGTESEKWTSHGGISVGKGEGRNRGEKVQGRSIIHRHKTDGEREKWYRKQRTERIYMYNPWTWTKGWRILEGWGAGQSGDKGRKIGKTNSIINKKYVKKKNSKMMFNSEWSYCDPRVILESLQD